MSTRPETMEYIMDQLDPLPVSNRKMFGEYALYFAGKPVGFVCDDTLGIKVTEVTDELLTTDMLGPIYPGSKDYWLIPGELLEDRDWLQSVLTQTAAVVPLPKPKKPKSPKPKSV